MSQNKKRIQRKQLAQNLLRVKELVELSIASTIVTGTPDFDTSSREYPDAMWDALQWLGNKVCHPDTTTGELAVNETKAKAVALILADGVEAEANAWVADLVVAMDHFNVMYGEEGTAPTPFPI